MASHRQELIEIIRNRGLRRFTEPVTLASGEKSTAFIDAKAALSRGPDLELACREIVETVGDLDWRAVGGLTMGADHLSHGVALVSGREWFVVRKQPKGRGTNQLVEGATIDAGSQVLLVDDVVTTGGSIQKAHRVLVHLGATVVAASTMVDRGEVAATYFDDHGVPYFPLVTYRDLDLEPVNGGALSS